MVDILPFNYITMDKETLLKRIESAKTLGGHPRFYDLLVQIAELHAKKNHDYAEDTDPLSNLKQAEKFGIPPYKGVFIRLSDKWSRIEELSKKPALIVTESLQDTLMDNAVYSLLAIILMEEEIAKKKAAKTP